MLCLSLVAKNNMKKTARKPSPLEFQFLLLLKKNNLCSGMYREFKFYKFRFDFAWPDSKLLIEVQSHQWHHTKYQLENDRRKLNIATANGWKVYQFSSFLLKKHPQLIVDLIRKVL